LFGRQYVAVKRAPAGQPAVFFEGEEPTPLGRLWYGFAFDLLFAAKSSLSISLQ
jgi:hypothetical protein